MSSKYIAIKKSAIHGRGVFAKQNIKKGACIIEYLGEKITKAEADIRTKKRMKFSRKNRFLGGVYIFELNKRYDLDGLAVKNNPARLINHSCLPNCEAVNDSGRIWIRALKNIKKGEELKYNYGYEFGDDWKDYPCNCKSKNCIGYILHRKNWNKIRKLKNEKKHRKKDARTKKSSGGAFRRS